MDNFIPTVMNASSGVAGSPLEDDTPRRAAYQANSMTAQSSGPVGVNGQAGILTDWYQQYAQSKPEVESYTPAQASVTNWQPNSQSTVQGQLTGILDKGGPLMDRAQTRALESMNQRGLLNSSMAVSAGQSALYDAAMPIAQQDANTFADAGKTNTMSANTASLNNAGFMNTAGQFKAGSQNDALTQQRGAGINLAQLREQAAAQERLQGNQQTFTAGQNALDRTQQTNILGAQQNFQSAQLALDRAQQVALTDKSIEAQKGLQTAQQNFQAAQSQLDRTQQTTLQGSQQDFQSKQLLQQHANTLEQMGYQSKLATAQVPSQYAANISATTMQQVGVIMADPNLDAAAKKNAVDNVVNYANSQLSWAEKFYGTTINPIALPGAPAPAPAAAPAAGPAPAPPAAPAPAADQPWQPYDPSLNGGGP